MSKTFVGTSLLAFALLLRTTGLCDSREQDQAAVRNVVQTQQQDAWNRHDAKAYASLFTEDGDCVNVVGWWWKGRAEIEKKLTAAYAFVFKDSVLTITAVDVRFLTPDMAVTHVRWSMVGAKTPKALPKPQEGIQTQVLQKKGDKWLIAVFQNTNALPEFPFPQGPPLAQPGAGNEG
jgi:uncharacterized protein (TIGR02246 family)